MSDMEKACFTVEVSKYLDIGESTLRKWCIELERNGYTFKKGLKESRAFTDHDLGALTYFKQLVKVKNHTKEQAAELVVKKFKEKRSDVSLQENNNIVEILNELLYLVREQSKFNSMILQELRNLKK